MSIAVLYRWCIRAGHEERFRQAWTEGTREIHDQCQSYGARLHQAADGLFWSYACWASEDHRKRCFSETDWPSTESFKAMAECIEERLPEILLDICDDELRSIDAPKNMPVLETARLRLRGIRRSDAAALLPALSSDENMRYWSSGPLESVDALADYLHWNIHAQGVECVVMVPKDAEDPVGWVNLMQQGRSIAEIGFILRPDAQGRGYAREAAVEVIRYAFEHHRLRRLYADVDPDNAPSIALIEALGFRYEGRLRGAWETHIGVRDSLIYGMLAGD